MQSQKKNRFSMESSKSTGFGLTEAEAIEILNLVPSEPVELHLIVEELQSRLSERQQEELLALVATHRDSAEISKTEPEPEAEDLIEEDAAALEQDNGGEATFLPIETEINAATTVVKMEPPSIKQEE
uniref:DNA-directed RNA polymerase III subunit RPC9 n=1 Tax=Entomoneis paludosa TaxID=265537 RepID=A0A7S2VAI0_9STRA